MSDITGERKHESISGGILQSTSRFAGHLKVDQKRRSQKLSLAATWMYSRRFVLLATT
jgi:hypothetical protein